MRAEEKILVAKDEGVHPAAWHQPIEEIWTTTTNSSTRRIISTVSVSSWF